MLFHELSVGGAFQIDLERLEDSRGFFARAFCRREFSEHGLPVEYPQSNISFSHSRGTVRGVHFRCDGREAKLIRCIGGAVYDVIVDLRPESPTYGRWVSVELSAANRTMVYVPPGCGHGHQTLTGDAELYYQMSDYYAPEYERGVRWDDPTLAIDWPLPPSSISDRDRELPSLAEAL
jgi:dTDP-4-dehydrorhamnose 3,5-epimerase